MKRAILLTSVVLCVTSVANATVSFEDTGLTVTVNSTATFNIVSNDTAAYLRYVGNTPGIAKLTKMEKNPSDPGICGPDAQISPDPYGYDGYFSIEAKDSDPDTWDIVSGIHWRGTVTTYGSPGTYYIDLYHTNFTTLCDTLPITIVPEPMTIALFGLGGLLLRRRK